ncbi:MAG: hypothetical protein QM644_16875 [Mobilitalea sp.]
MRKHFKNYRRFYTILGMLIIILLVYFFLPRTFKVSDEENVMIDISKEIEGSRHFYELNAQEVSDFVKTLEKSRFYRGVSRPEHTFADKSINVMVVGGLGPLITIYYNTDKTYVYANISTGPFLNVYHRISNQEDIVKFVEDIVNTKTEEFVQVPTQ